MDVLRKTKAFVLATVMAVALSCTVSFWIHDDACAATGDHTQSEAVAWLADQANQEKKYDDRIGVGCQCVCFAKAYYEWLGYGYARYGNGSDFEWNYPDSGFTRLYGVAPEPGDIVVWGAYYFGSGNWTGHVAVCINGGIPFRCVEQDGNCNWRGAHYSSWYSGVPTCVIRPNFRSSDTTGPSVDSLKVSELDSRKFTVSAHITDSSGIASVKYAVWTVDAIGSGSDQDDLVWYDGHCTDGNDVYWAHVPFSEHYNQLDTTYVIHAYVTDNAGNQSVVPITQYITRSKPSVVDFHVGELRDGAFSILAHITSPAGISYVQYAVWTNDNGQDDLVWYDGHCTDGNDVYWAHVNFSEHNGEKGKYTIHCYVHDNLGGVYSYGITYTFSNTGPKIENVVISEMDSTGYTVSCDVADNGMGTKKVQFPTWTVLNGQDDLAAKWKTNSAVSGTRDGDSFSFRVKASEHNGELGAYVTHIYAFDSIGNSTCYELPSVNVHNHDWQDWSAAGGDPAGSTGLSASCSICGEALSVSPRASSAFEGCMYLAFDRIRGLSWTSAKAACEALGGHLVTIGSAEEQQAVDGLIAGNACNYHAGASDADVEGAWRWVTGEALTYQNWASGEPNDDKGQDYMRIYPDGTWDDVNIAQGTGSGFICEVPLSGISSTVAFDANGGSCGISSKEVVSYAAYGELPVPTRENYGFAGWFTDPLAGTQVTADSIVHEISDSVLYAHWVGMDASVSFDPGLGNCETSEKGVVFGSTYGELPDAEREGYGFEGWFTAAVGGDKVSSSSTVSSPGDFTLYAHWARLAESDWISADELPEGEETVREKWVYARTETTTSLESTIEGWERTGDAWIATGSGTNLYAGIPAGFADAHELRAKYGNGSLSYYETGASKRTVSTYRTGHIYWHWTCNKHEIADDNYDVPIRDRYCWDDGQEYFNFRAFEMDDDEEKDAIIWRVGDLLGGEARFRYWRDIPEDGSWWWFRLDTYRQDYTDYELGGSFRRVTEGLESETEVVAEGEIGDVRHMVTYIRPVSDISHVQVTQARILPGQVLSAQSTDSLLHVAYAGAVLEEGADYEASFEEDAAGTVIATITGKGRFEGTLTTVLDTSVPDVAADGLNDGTLLGKVKVQLPAAFGLGDAASADVRLAFGIDDLEYQSIGLLFSATASDDASLRIGGAGVKTYATRTVYSKIFADGVLVDASAAFAGDGKRPYAAAVRLSGIPSSMFGRDLHVRAFAIRGDDGKVVYGPVRSFNVAGLNAI